MQHDQQSQNALAQAREIAHKASELWQQLQLQGRSPIGLEFAQHGINAVQLQRNGKSLKLAAAASTPYTASQEETLKNPVLLKRTIDTLLENSGFIGNEAVVSAPMGAPKILSLSLKSAAPKDIPRQVMELVKERLGGDDNEWLVDYLVVNLNVKNIQETTVMAAALRRHESLMFMQHLQTAGLHLHAVEIAPQALQRLLTFADAPQANCLVINFGQTSSYVSHFLHGRLTMDREISLGYHDFVAPISQSLEIDPELANNLFHTLGFGNSTEISPLVSETFVRLKAQIDLMNQYIGSQLHGDGIDCIYLTGEAANWPHACSAFSQVLGYPTETLNILELLDTTKNLSMHLKQQATLSIAAGLALRWQA